MSDYITTNSTDDSLDRRGFLHCMAWAGTGIGQSCTAPARSFPSRWLAQGKANAEIATILGLTPGTVKLYVEHILTKLDVDNRVMAAMDCHGISV